MLTVEKAICMITDAIPSVDKEIVQLNQASGRVLQQSVKAERDQPPFDRVTMDGIAIKFDSFTKGITKFAIKGTQQAGDQVHRLCQANDCLEIMTGSVLPKGSDCVVPVERISIKNDRAHLENGYAH